MTQNIKIYNSGYENCKLPICPNFIIRIEDNFPIPLGEISDAQLKKIGKAWTDGLLKRAKQQRKNKIDGWKFVEKRGF